MPYIDISPPVYAATAVFPGDTPFSLGWTMRQDRGDSCSVSALTLSPHTGAHVDAPFHVLADGERAPRAARIADLEVEPFIGRCRVVSSEKSQPITAEHVARWPLDGVERLLIRTRAVVDPAEFPRDGAYLTAEGAAALAGRVRLVGVDTASVDHWQSKELPAHRALFAAGVAILEGLDLSAVDEGDYDLIALPLRLVDADASPVRAVLRRLDAAPESAAR